MKRILLVGTRKTTLDSLIATIQPHGYELTTAQNQRAALSAARRTPPDVIILDATSTRLGAARLSETLQRQLAAPVIAIVREREDFPHLGDVHLLVRPYTAQELMECIERALDYRSILRCGPLELDLRSRAVRCPHLPEPRRLPPKQFSLLRLLMTHHGAPVSREAIMNEVWETGFVEDTRTLDVHIRWLREAIEPDPSAPIYLHTIRGVGYSLLCD